MTEKRLQHKTKEFKDFKKKVKNEGSSLIKIALNDSWFDSIYEDATKVWAGDGTDPYKCKFFPYRWLCEEKQWEFINNGLKKIDQLTHKKQMLRNTLLKIVSNEWMVAHAAAFEINALCKFVSDNVLVEIEPKIVSDREYRSDALIKIDKSNILIELTAITKNFGDPIKTSVITLSTEQLINQLMNKIKEKAEPGKQLSYNTKPSVLIIALLPGFGVDLIVAEWAMDKNVNLYPKINSYIVSDTFLFKYGDCYINNKAEYPLTKKEVDYLSDLLIAYIKT